MKPYQKLRQVHDILTAYQREQGVTRSIARIVTAIEEELHRKPDKCPLCGGEVWTQEELDAAQAQAEVWYKLFYPGSQGVMSTAQGDWLKIKKRL